MAKMDTKKFTTIDNDGIIERLEQVKKVLGTNNVELAKVFGITKASMGDILSGKSRISVDKLYTLGTEYNVSLDYLISNNANEMFVSLDNGVAQDKAIELRVNCLLVELGKIDSEEEKALLLKTIIHRLTEI